MADITLPNGWNPREYALPLWNYMEEGGRNACAVWHRRAGKDSTAINITCVKAHERIGTYWHMLPEKEQARKAIWNGLNKDGVRIIDQAFPLEIRRKTVDDEMRIELKCGSQWQVVGSDAYNSLVGTNPVGVVNSEYSISNPAADEYLRPILLENGGWSMYLYTPRGKNHGYHLFQMAKKNPTWFAQLLTVNETMVIDPADIQRERDAGADDDLIQQEYFCSWAGVRQGSIYGAQISKMRATERVGKFPYDRRYPVQTFWDIGHRDAAAVICHQAIGGMDRLIAAHECVGQDVPYFASWLRDTGYLFGEHYLPHDAKNITMASKSNALGENIWTQCENSGLKNLVQVPRVKDKWTAINTVRSRFDSLEIDEEGCQVLLDAIESYHKKWDDAKRTFLNDPVHDWTSNLCDALAQWAQGWKGRTAGVKTFTQAPQVREAPTYGGQSRLPGRINTVGNRRVGY